MQSKSITVCIVSLIAAGAACLADFPKPLKSATTREELAKHFGMTIGFGKVEKWEFTTAGRELIIFSYCPYSGRAACYVHAYYHDQAKQAWILFVDRLLEPATGLSAEISADHSLVFKDRDGKIVARESIADLPR
jgi:hypothetical protein